MSIVCSSCGQETPEGFPRCANCGAPLADAAPPREERKVVTVLFCDLVGSTARAEGADPEDVRALLSAYHERVRAELERFGGTVEKFIGDAVMALFGAPVAHEDDPERAVRAALAIRDWAQEEGDLQVRIGITTGEALVALGASPQAGEGMAAGDVVNTAARLQAAAPVNGIIVDEITYRAASHVIDFSEHEPVEAKGKAAPVPAWEAVRIRAHVSEGMRAPLVGREEESEVLRNSLTQTRRERVPQLVTLVGVPGIGKSRLVEELKNSVAEPDSVTWRQGRSLPYGEGVSFWAFGEIVKEQAGILDTDPPEVAEGKLRSAVAGAVADERDAAWLGGHLAPLVGLGGEGAAGEDRRAESFAAWRRFVAALAAANPLVLVFEDLHWADDGLLDFVESLLEWLSDVPLLLLGTARPELLERRPSWGASTNAAVVPLAPLDDEQTAALIGKLLERPLLPAEQQAALLEQAGGNPLYAEQYVRMLRERGETGAVPETVQGLITARLDALPEAEKSLLQSAAVVGKVFWAGAVAAVASLDRWTVEEQLQALERKEFLRRSRAASMADETEYAFAHVLIRDVAYGQIPRAARAEKHRLAAEWIESLGRPDDHAEMVAHHYAVAFDLARAAGQETAGLAERAHAALVRAADRALALNAFAAAAGFYERALELPVGVGVDRPDVVFGFGRALVATGDERSSEVLEEATEALLEAGVPEAAAEAQILLARVWMHRGSRERQLKHLARAQALVGERPSAARAHVLRNAASLSAAEGEEEQALALAEEALQLADALDLAEVRSSVLSTLGQLKYSMGDRTGLSDLERALEIVLEADSPLTPGAYNALAATLLDAGDVRRTVQLHAEAMEAAERFGRRDLLRFLRSWQPAVEQFKGRWDECLRVADQFVAECESSPHYGEPWARGDRAVVRFARDDVEGALDDLARALELAREAQAPPDFLYIYEVSASYFAELGRLEEASAPVDEVLRYRGGEIGWAYTLVALAWAGERLGRSAEVLDFIDAVRAPSRWLDAARAITRGEYAVAADIFVEIGSRNDEAYARLRAAEAFVERGRRAEADEQLQKALAFYRSVGATRYIREGEALLAKSA